MISNKDIFAVYDYKQFPYEEGLTVILNWKQGKDDIASTVHIAECNATIDIHPLKFPSMVQELYGSMAALDMLKVLIRQNTDRIFEEGRMRSDVKRISPNKYVK